MQRIHLNYVENINLASIAVSAAGLVNTNYGVGVGIAYIIGRYLLSDIDSYTQFFISVKEVHVIKEE